MMPRKTTGQRQSEKCSPPQPGGGKAGSKNSGKAPREGNFWTKPPSCGKAATLGCRLTKVGDLETFCGDLLKCGMVGGRIRLEGMDIVALSTSETIGVNNF